ncbi:bile acid:sodium symporter family protein [Alteribacillus sp. JSM 102045]|uniref:bile acid:sodium symporter family protein n=1 Tax=Alteribacillus sp. JSM 102045 TaxID=1562101 RepID=UPI0035BED2BB
MNKINEILSQLLSFLIVLLATFTYFSPIHLDTASWVPSVLLGVVIFFTGLSMNMEAIRGIGSKKKEIFIAALLKWTLTVLISIALANLFFTAESEIAAGIILSGTVPSATAATLYTFLAGGNTALVIVGSLLDTAISPVVTVLAMMSIPRNQVVITFIDLFQSFLLIVILPLSLGIFIQRVWPKSVDYSKNMTKFGSSLSLLLIVHIIVGEGKEAVATRLDVVPLMVGVILIQVLLPMALAYYIAKKWRTAEEDARAILFHVGLCNTALAAILAFEFIGELGAVPPIINTIINLSLGALVSNYFRNKK